MWADTYRVKVVRREDDDVGGEHARRERREQRNHHKARHCVISLSVLLLFKPRTAQRRAPNQHSAPSPRLCACAPMGHRASTSLSHHHARPCPPPTSPPTSPGPRPPYPTARLAYPIYPYSASCLSPYIPRDLALRDHRDRRPSGAPTSSFLPSTSQSMESTLRWGSPQTQPDGEPQFVVALSAAARL